MKHSYRSIFSAILASLALSTVASHAQLKTGSNPATLTTNTNLEVEATNGKKLLLNKADGTLTYQHTTQGDGKILTSDANGVATWQVPQAGTIAPCSSDFSGKGTYVDLDPAVSMSPIYLGWKFDLSPGVWLINLDLTYGSLVNQGVAWISLIDDSGTVVVNGITSVAADSGCIHRTNPSKAIRINVSGTYRLAITPFGSWKFKGYIGLGGNYSDADVTNTTVGAFGSVQSIWVCDPAFSATIGDVSFYRVIDTDPPQAVKLR